MTDPNRPDSLPSSPEIVTRTVNPDTLKAVTDAVVFLALDIVSLPWAIAEKGVHWYKGEDV